VTKYRRSPYLVSYWEGGRLLLHNYATGRRAPGAPLLHQILDVFDRWRTLDDLRRALPEAPPAALRRAIETLAAATFLERTTGVVSPRETNLASWSEWNPAAGFFHLATKDVRYAVDLESAGRRMRDRARARPMPPAVKRYRGVPKIALPPVGSDDEFAQALLARRTWRRFSDRAAPVQMLSTVLGLTFGVQRWIDLPGVGTVALKTSPSGGARHPIECYVLALRVAGVARGLYHYRADTHALERLATRTSAKDVARYLPGQEWFGGASALVFMTAVFARTQWRYPFARAYRVVLAESGHLCQTFCLTASRLGLAPFCTMALADSIIERDLGIDGVSESVLYAAGFGTRPAGVDWAPWPSRRRRSRASTKAGRVASAPSQRRRNSS
jgi:SagB-type dehydrogenase family enzyme